MQEATLVADSDRDLGSASSRRLRKEGQVPGVLYGKGGEATPLSVSSKELRAILLESGGNAVVRLQVAGEEHLALVKDIQRHPVAQSIDHIDFVLVSATDSVHVEVPIHLIGEAEAVGFAGGVVEQAIFHVHVHCSPVAIPAFVEADITGMELGVALTAAAIVLPEGVELDLDESQTIASAHLTRAAIADEVDETEEDEDGEEDTEEEAE
jgi:large subunit ribosomal protein L25